MYIRITIRVLDSINILPKYLNISRDLCLPSQHQQHTTYTSLAKLLLPFTVKVLLRFSRVGLRGGGGSCLGRVASARVATHPRNEVEVSRAHDAGVVVVPPLLEGEDHRHADTQPSHERKSHCSLGRGRSLTHGINRIHDGGVALSSGGHEGSEEEDVKDSVAQELRDGGRYLLQQVCSHSDEGEQPVDNEEGNQELEHGELGVATTKGPTFFECLGVRPGESSALARHSREGGKCEELLYEDVHDEGNDGDR